ncbi:MAG: protein kinase, partial [Gemmatimonadota bacterium]
DRYKVVRQIGEGGMATVYLAYDIRHEREVALKVLRPELGRGSDRFIREIKLAASLRHPHILPVHDSGTVDGLLYYVMPFAEGESLRERLDREGSLPLESVSQIVEHVAGALSHAHGKGVVHRDIKPGNILLEQGHAVVADFGIAVVADAMEQEGMTHPGLVMGTPVYMSPEQIDAGGVLDARSDIYSVACVAYEMLTGAPPFAGATPLAVLSKRMTGKLPPIERTDVAPEVHDAISRGLALEPVDRPATISEFANTLIGALRAPLAQVHRSTDRSEKTSIAVLPFANMSADPDNEYFSDGMTEDVINALSQVSDLQVASRTSSFAFKHKGQDIRDIGRLLNVRTVLEGSVRKYANRLRVTAQLIDVDSGYHLWSEQYEREMADVFAIQDEISCAIVETLKGTLVSQGAENLVKSHTDNMHAYDLYLKGRYFWNQRGAGLQKAALYFKEAIAEDPEYALAHSALADTYSLFGWYRAMAPREAFPIAMEEAQRALDLDRGLAEAQRSLAFVLLMHEWDWIGAGRAFNRALELNPGLATTHHWYAEYLMAMGRLTDAIDHSKKALELDPLGLIIHVLLGMAYYLARRPADSVRECLKTLEMEPAFAPTFIWLGQAYLQLEEYDKAIDAFQREVELAPERPTTAAYLAASYALAGDRARARKALDELRARSEHDFVSCFDYAVIHFALEEDEEGFRWIDCAYEERAPWLVWLRVDPLFDRVRPDPRFQQLLARMRLDWA